MESLTQCLICGADRLDPLIAVDGWTIVECRACRLGMLSPRPDDKELSALYQEPYFASHGMDRDSTGEVARRIRDQRKRVNLVKSFVRGGKLLDVGCAVGYFLAAANREGFAVEGVERSVWAAEEAKRRFSVNAHVGDIDRLADGEPRFDAVTMWHVLEHTPDAASALTAARTLLRAKGKLFIEVPNYLGTDAKGYGTDWSGWDVPNHLWHFTPGSLSKLLAKCGFQVVSIKRHPSTYIRNRLKTIPVVGLFRNLVCLLYSGRDFTVVAAKA